MRSRSASAFRRKTLEKVNASDHRGYRDYYTTALIEGVSRLYGRDLEAFGYDF